jgi:hypothetical protein
MVEGEREVERRVVSEPIIESREVAVLDSDVTTPRVTVYDESRGGCLCPM